MIEEQILQQFFLAFGRIARKFYVHCGSSINSVH